MATTGQIGASATGDGLTINGDLINAGVPLEQYEQILGLPSRAVEAGPPAPVGHRNNLVHIFDSKGIYLIEHHASRLIGEVTFIFDAAESPFPISGSFRGALDVFGHPIRSGMCEREIERMRLVRNLPGEYSAQHGNFWVGVSARGRRDSRGKRRKPRYLVSVSVCF